jgi:hypothetical protein
MERAPPRHTAVRPISATTHIAAWQTISGEAAPAVPRALIVSHHLAILGRLAGAAACGWTGSGRTFGVAAGRPAGCRTITRRAAR